MQVDPRDPWGLGRLMARQGQMPVMPPMHGSRTIHIGHGQPAPHLMHQTMAHAEPTPPHHSEPVLHNIGHAVMALAHFMASGNRKQLNYEKARAITYALQGGPGGTAMPYADAKSIAHAAVYNRGRHPRR
jgi:hypothetical protein